MTSASLKIGSPYCLRRKPLRGPLYLEPPLLLLDLPPHPVELLWQLHLLLQPGEPLRQSPPETSS